MSLLEIIVVIGLIVMGGSLISKAFASNMYNGVICLIMGILFIVYAIHIVLISTCPDVFKTFEDFLTNPLW